jgi:hypothetical protein
MVTPVMAGALMAREKANWIFQNEVASPIITFPESDTSREIYGISTRVPHTSGCETGMEVGPELPTAPVNRIRLTHRQAGIPFFQHPFCVPGPEVVQCGEFPPRRG